MLKIDQIAPDFTLQDQNGTSHTLSGYKGKLVLIYFYPKDDTPGCTKEACGIRDYYKEFEKNGIKVFGISTDSVKSHKKFEEKYGLPFTLLSDETKEVVQKYEVWGEKTFMGKKYMGTFRNSFLINPNGKIVKIYENVKPEEHAKEILEDVKGLI